MESIDTTNKPKEVVFNGVKYHLVSSSKYYLEYHTKNKDRVGAKGLHVAIWEYYNGTSVPKGYCIHHKDGNTFNNDISNLECISRYEHLSMHAKDNFNNEEFKSKTLENLAKARQKAKDWHKSEEGIEWHRRNAMTRKLEEKPITCKMCGKEFKSVYADTMFCSNSCGSKYRRKYVLDYVGVCKECGKEFRYGKGVSNERDREFCSMSCRTRYTNKHRRRN